MKSLKDLKLIVRVKPNGEVQTYPKNYDSLFKIKYKYGKERIKRIGNTTIIEQTLKIIYPKLGF